jgi:galactokinase
MKPISTSVTKSTYPRAKTRPEEIRKLFRTLYNEDCLLFRAPGRINLIGEHTDYNDGFVLPAAIDLQCWVGVAPDIDRRVQVQSANLNESRSFDLDHPQRLGDWSDYIQGVAFTLEALDYRFPGARMIVSSEVPIGSGLSSSAALEIAAGLALLGLQPKPCQGLDLVKACQRAENEFVGSRCGIMDQFVSVHAKAGHLNMIDCRSLEHKFVPVPEEARLVVCNTMVKHSLASGEYNVRRAQCEEGVRLLSGALPGISALRDLSLDDLERFRELLSPTVFKRCRHVISENQRVLATAAALEERSWERFGELMADSHRSLREDYEVSCPELDLMVELANGLPGVYGARMTGGGFGGCTINVVAVDAMPQFTTQIAAAYQAQTGIAPELHVSTAAEGAGRWVEP